MGKLKEGILWCGFIVTVIPVSWGVRLPFTDTVAKDTDEHHIREHPCVCPQILLYLPILCKH